MAKLDEFLMLCSAKGASDLHMSSGVQAFIRLDGDLEPITEDPISSHDLQTVLFEILSQDERDKFNRNRNLDKSYRVDGVGNFRCNYFMTRRGIAAVFRTIPDKIPTMEDLGLPDALKKVVEAGKGLILVTGPTGSGKSTTLAALINHLNLNEKFHILTVEDPIEFVHHNQQSLINQREIGAHCATFSDALKYALREDPDVILVGEMRDLETISLAMTAAETGHLVFGTLHTRGAGSSVDRIIDSFPANQQAMIRTMLAESLVAVVSQALLKKVGGGRVGAFEILVSNHAISNLIREGKTFQIPSAMQTGRKEGMIIMDQYILDLVDQGLVEPDEAEGYMEDPSALESRRRSWGQKLTKLDQMNEPTQPYAKPITNIEASKNDSLKSKPKTLPKVEKSAPILKASDILSDVQSPVTSAKAPQSPPSLQPSPEPKAPAVHKPPPPPVSTSKVAVAKPMPSQSAPKAPPVSAPTPAKHSPPPVAGSPPKPPPGVAKPVSQTSKQAQPSPPLTKPTGQKQPPLPVGMKAVPKKDPQKATPPVGGAKQPPPPAVKPAAIPSSAQPPTKAPVQASSPPANPVVSENTASSANLSEMDALENSSGETGSFNLDTDTEIRSLPQHETSDTEEITGTFASEDSEVEIPSLNEVGESNVPKPPPPPPIKKKTG